MSVELDDDWFGPPARPVEDAPPEPPWPDAAPLEGDEQSLPSNVQQLYPSVSRAAAHAAMQADEALMRWTGLELIRGSDARAPANADAWHVVNLMRPNTVNVWAASEGDGKTYIEVQLGIQAAVAPICGGLFGHYPIPSPLTTVIFDEENGDAQMWRAEEHVLASLGVERAELGDRYWRLSLNGLRLAERKHQEQIEELLLDVVGDEPAIAFFDTAGAMIDGDEWGANIREPIRFLRRLTKIGQLATVALTHLRKPSGGAAKDDPTKRALHDVVGNWARHADAVAVISNLGDNPPRRRWQMYKRVPASTVVLSADSGAWQAVHGPDDAVKAEDLVMFAIDEGATTEAAIVAATGKAERTVQRALAELRRQGVLSSRRGVIAREDR